jgi:MFS family permease
VAILLVAYAVSFLDRQIISLLVAPIKADLLISDTQVGALQGTAFGVFFALMGWPLGWLSDRVHRVGLIALAIVTWSAMTIASGLADSFSGLLLARIGVGIGEAALVPAAVSLLSDYFPPQRRALPLSIFTSGISVGLGLALLLGGVLVTFAHDGVSQVPWLGSWLAAQRGWQVVFILSGLAGLPVAVLVLLLHEPERQSQRLGASATAALGYLWQQRAVVGSILLATSLLYVLTNSFSAWVPVHLMRRFAWTAAETGRTLGPPVMLVAIAGNWLSGAITQLLARRGVQDAPLLTMMLGTGLMLPAVLIGVLTSNADLAVAGVLASYFAIALTFGIATTAYVTVTPAAVRGQVIAIYLLCGNLLGLGLGPLLVGAIADHGPRSLQDIGAALAVVSAAVILPALWFFQRARSRFARAALAAAVSPSTASPSGNS